MAVDETVPTNAELLDEARKALRRVLRGATFVTVNGQQFRYANVGELRAMIAEYELKVAEGAGTDGRGAWEAVFNG
jgi:enoyl-CoA hydratase/carnithine racemase